MGCLNFPLYEAQMKISGHMESSTEIMTEMNYLIKVPEIKYVATKLQKEMIKVNGNYL